MPTPSKGIRLGRGGPDISRPLFVMEDRGYKTPCWTWVRKLNDGGYPIWHRKEHPTCMAHIQLWQMFNGSVPDGLELDHLCRNRSCVRPDHLEAVVHRENVRRGLVRRFTDEQIEACISDAIQIGCKPAARKHKMNRAWLRELMTLRNLKSPLKTGRQPHKGRR